MPSDEPIQLLFAKNMGESLARRKVSLTFAPAMTELATI